MKKTWKPVFVFTNHFRPDSYYSRDYLPFGIVVIGGALDLGDVYLKALERNQSATYKGVHRYMSKHLGAVFSG